MPDTKEMRIRELREKAGRLGPMLDGCLQAKRNRVANKDGDEHISPEHYQFQYRGPDGKQRWKSIPRTHCAEVRRMIARGREYRRIEREYAALVTEATLADVGKKKRLTPGLPRPEWANVESVLLAMECAPLSPEGVPEGSRDVDARLLGAARKDLLAFLGKLFTLLGMRLSSGGHSVRPVQILTAMGWAVALECYLPKRPSILRPALGIRDKATAAARDAVERCGALCGSFSEGADTLLRLTGIRVSVSKLRKMTLAFGKACAAEQMEPPADKRQYAAKPANAVTKVKRTLFFMADGGSANCCKADTEGIPGKDGGEAGTRQIRVGILGEYEWLDKDGRPAPWQDSFSYFVSGETIDKFTPQMKKHGLARGSGTAPRMQCVADGETALEDAFRDAFPHAEFTNDFAHASDHLHDCCFALGLEDAPASKEYRFCRGLLYRAGAESAVRRIRRLYQKKLDASPDALRHLLYLESRKDNMRYGWLRKNGYYIGSGHVEAAVRVLVVRRCKQAGMHWRHNNAISISAIHAIYRSHRKAA